MLRASIVIPAYNAAGSLGRCLDAVLDQTVPREEYEVLVVDDGSADGTVQAALAYGVRAVAQPHRGPAAARNLGARYADGPVVVFTDADCRPTRAWLAAMLRPLDRPEVTGVKGRYATDQRGVVARLVQYEYEEKYQRLASQEYIDFIDTYSAAYRREVFLANGGFDTAFLTAAMEDPEFSFRLAERGYQLVFAPDAVVFHTHADSWRRYLRRKFRVGWWAILNGWKHPRKVVRDSRTPAGQRAQLVLLALSVPAVLGALVQPGWWRPLPVLAAAFLATSAPLARVVWSKDRGLTPFVPLLVFLRASGLLAGLSSAIVAFSGRWLLRKLARRREFADA